MTWIDENPPIKFSAVILGIVLIILGLIALAIWKIS